MSGCDWSSDVCLPILVQLFLHGDATHSHLAAVVEVVDGASHSPAGLVAAFGEPAAAAGKPAPEHVRAVVLAPAPLSLAPGTTHGTGKPVRPDIRSAPGRRRV